MTAFKAVFRLLALLTICLAAVPGAMAASFTYTGSFTADNSVYTQTFNTATTQDFTIYTTSYGGGINANGTNSSAGGFVPVVTLFGTSGDVIGFGGGDGMCSGSSLADSGTGLCEDAYFTGSIGPGSYTLALTEFPNVAVGNLSDGFLFSSDPTATGDLCGVSGGTFLQTDVAPCVQRNGNFALNVVSSAASPVPEPPTWLLVLPATAAIALFGRRQLFA